MKTTAIWDKHTKEIKEIDLIACPPLCRANNNRLNLKILTYSSY
jgi:hypothetical protein